MIERIVVTALVAGALGAAPAGARIETQPPEPAAAALTAPVVAKLRLSNGLQVWIVEQHGLPVVQMTLLVQSGTAADPRGRYGTASLASAMLTQGAGSRTAVEIADELDRLLANLSASSDVDSTTLQLYVPLGGLAEALALMADASQRPAFPKPELDRLRQQRLVALRNARADPDATAALAFARAAFGSSHRSAAPLIGTEASLEAVTPDDLKAYHQAAYRPDNSTLIVFGDVVPGDVLPLLETHFGKWQAAGGNRVSQDAAPLQKPARQLTLVDMPGAPQSRILAGGVGGPNSMSDFFPMQVLNAIVRNRLSPDRNAIVRDYTAGVRTGFDLRKSATPFIAATAAQSDKTAQCLKVLVDELGAMAKGVPSEELAQAKEEVVRDFPRTFETRGRISSRLRTLESLVVYGLPDNYYANHAAAIQSVGLADIRRVAQQYMDPDHLTIVIAGDRKTIEPSLGALKLGSITNVSVDEVFAPAK
jgi:zinc protease